MDQTKICKKCGQAKTLDNFSKDNSSSDKLWRYCRDCESQRKQKSRLRTLIPLRQNTGLTNICVSRRGIDSWLKANSYTPTHLDRFYISETFGTNICGIHFSPFLKIGDESDKKSIIVLSGSGLKVASEFPGYTPTHDFGMKLSDFEKCTIQTLIHESNHEILQQDHDEFTSRCYDNIYVKKLRKYGFLA